MQYINYNKQNGGAGLFFKNNTKFFIMANVSNSNIISEIDNRRKLLLLGNKPVHSDVHFTLLQFNINQDHPNAKFFYDPVFHRKIWDFYDDSIRKNKLTLKYIRGLYDLLGLGEKKFFAKIYQPNQPELITEFRKAIYKYIGSELGKYKIRKKKNGKDMFYVFSLKGMDLISVPEFYFGIGVWTPHISVVNLKDVAKYNQKLYKKYEGYKTKRNKLNTLLQPILKAKFDPIGDINMEQDVNFLRVSLQNSEERIHIESIL